MNLCVTCHKELTLEIDSGDDDGDLQPGSSADNGRTVPDSVELTCGCHFHWECLLDAYSMSECPKCGANISSLSRTGQEHILCNLNNEGGLQEGLDIMPLLVEASYLKAYPEERKARAFVEFAGEGDAISMIDMLKDSEDGEEDEEEEAQKIDLLQYQDPIGGMSSALHAAVNNNNVTVAWLLLWLASRLDTAKFPPGVSAQAQELDLSREGATEKNDIRSLRDSGGMTAKERAAALGGVWVEWLNHGWLDEL